MIDVESIKQEIRNLIAKYNKVLEEKQIDKYNEEMTKKDFILPLFRALGWNTENSNEVTAEEKISKTRVDYGFRINGIPKFFLEAKSLKEDLDNSKFIEQAINYAWHKGCTWAVLTDFESVKIFNAEWRTSSPLQSHLKTITYREYIDRFDELWLLSKESFEQGFLDKEAEKWGKKAKKIPVDKQLLLDFTRFRELLSKNITKLNQDKNLTEQDLDESTQRILDRLIFIRNCEDKELEAKVLISSFREWESRGKGQLIKSLKEVFAYFDKQYNSKIFANHLCDSLDIDSEVLYEIIEGLYYTKDRSVYYDFSAIEADILGNIYEQYLGHILKKSQKRAKLKESHAHRKEQGIYYTPSYIVNYIVKNTLGKLLKESKIDVEKVRVLDPACGSGSFLIKAFDILNEYYVKNDKEYLQTQLDFKTGLPFTKRLEILKNNIFGVDLDKQAIEIAQLNLLLKIAEKGQRLPLLQENIKCGNSLIDDPTVAGNKAFKWEDEFKEVMQEGGFDVVIGNPPYVRTDELDIKQRDFLSRNYETPYGKFDIYFTFIEKGLKVLKSEGRLGFIVPNRFLVGDTGSLLRKFILNNCIIEKIVDVSEIRVFKDANVHPVIIILKKEYNSKKRLSNRTISLFNIFSIFDIQNDIKTASEIPQEIFYVFDNLIINRLTQSDINLLLKLIKNKRLGDISTISEGIHTGRDKEVIVPKKSIRNVSNFTPVIRGTNLKRFLLLEPKEYINSKYIKNTDREIRMLNKNKIVMMELAPRITASLDVDKSICLGSIYFLTLKEHHEEVINMKYLLALLNSKLLSYFYSKIFSSTHWGGSLKYRSSYLEQLPIKILPESQQQPLINLVDKMLSLNEHLTKIGDKKTDERSKIEEEIKKTDNEIDKIVYDIYGITEEEKKVIEESFK